MTGFFILHRGISDHPMFYRRPDWLGAWVMIIEAANYKDTKTGKRGELKISQKSLQEKLGWSRKRVRYFLDELSSNGMISRDNLGSKKGHVGARITVCNYSKYQDLQNSEGHVGATLGPHTETRNKEQQEQTQQQPLNLEPARAESIKRPKRKPAAPVEPDRFDEFWEIYPRKEGKGQARKAWNAAVEKVDGANVIVDAIREQADELRRKGQYCKHPATWLNGECWEDKGVVNGRIKLTKQQIAERCQGMSHTEIRRFMGAL